MYCLMLTQIKAKSVLFYSFCLIFLTVTLLQAGSIPQQISYQGKLLENQVPVTGTKTFQFRFSGSSWSETHSNVQVQDGFYSVVLGLIQPIPESLFDDQSDVQLEISVEGSPLSPKIDVVSAAYAFKAAKAEDTRKIAGNPVQGTPQKDQVLKWNGREWSPGTISGGLRSVSTGSGLESSGTNDDLSIYIPAGGIAQVHMSNNAITSSKIQDGSIKPEDLSFVPSSISSIVTEQPLEGGGNAGVVKVSLKTNSISSAYLEDNAVTSDKIQDGTITKNDLKFVPGVITVISTGAALTGGGSSGKVKIEVADKGISEKHLAANSVNSDIIKDHSIEKKDLAFDTGDHLGNHVATQNLQMKDHWISNDGGEEGVYISNDGKVGIGKSDPKKQLDIEGDMNVSGESKLNSINAVNTNGLPFLNGFIKGCRIEWFGNHEIKVHKGIIEIGGSLYQILEKLSIETKEPGLNEGLYSIFVKKPDSLEHKSITKDDLHLRLNAELKWDDERFGWYLKDIGNDVYRCIGFFWVNSAKEIQGFDYHNGFYSYQSFQGLSKVNTKYSSKAIPSCASFAACYIAASLESPGGSSAGFYFHAGPDEKRKKKVYHFAVDRHNDKAGNIQSEVYTVALDGSGSFYGSSGGYGHYSHEHYLTGFYWSPDKE